MTLQIHPVNIPGWIHVTQERRKHELFRSIEMTKILMESDSLFHLIVSMKAQFQEDDSAPLSGHVQASSVPRSKGPDGLNLCPC